jgi:hypothetical protein
MPKSEWEIASDKTYRAIGRFIFEFSQAEYTIRHYLAEEIRLDEKYFAPVVESYDVGVLCTVAKQVFLSTRDGKNAARIKMLINKFLKMSHERNRVAHGLWVPFKDGGTVHHVPRGDLKPARFSEQADGLEEGADELREMRAQLEEAFLGPYLTKQNY